MRRWSLPASATGESPPASLLRRLATELGEPDDDARESATGDGARAGDRYLEAAAGMFERLMRDGCETRDRALDLLAVDALVTYALEADADSRPSGLEERAREAMLRFARLADPA